MTEAELIALEWNLPKLRAREDLQRYNRGELQLSAESIRNVVMRAWDDEELAQKYFEAEAIAEMDRKKARS